MWQRLFILMFFFSVIFCVGQEQETRSFVGKWLLNTKIENFILIDSTNETEFILDADQIYIMAIDKDGRQLWRTDPWKDNYLEEYRVERPIIVRFYFTNNRSGEEVIWIVYNNTQFGNINKLTGAFSWLGQD